MSQEGQVPIGGMPAGSRQKLRRGTTFVNLPPATRPTPVVASPAISPPPRSWAGEDAADLHLPSPTLLDTRFEHIDRSGASMAQRVKASEDALNLVNNETPTTGRKNNEEAWAWEQTQAVESPPSVPQMTGSQHRQRQSVSASIGQRAPVKAYKGEFSQRSDADDDENTSGQEENFQDAQSAGGRSVEICKYGVPVDEDLPPPLMSENEEENASDEGRRGRSPKKRKRYSEAEIVCMFQKAAEKFNIHDYVGNWWQKQLKNDPDLRAEYDAQASMPAKRNLRSRKVQEKLDELEEEYYEEEMEEGGTELQGQYLPFTRIWKEEGEDEEALEAARNYVKTVVGMHKEGRRGPKNKSGSRKTTSPNVLSTCT